MSESRLCAEAEVYPAAGRTLEYKASADAWLEDSRFTPLDSNVIAKLFQRYDTDANIKTVTHLFHSTLFAGGILFERSDAKLDVVSERWFDSTWRNWCLQLNRATSSIGFAACSFDEHSHYVGVPSCLELSRCVVLYRQDVLGRPHFVFFEVLDQEFSRGMIEHKQSRRPRSDLSLGAYQNMYRYIPNVVVYCESPPTPHGEIRSRVGVLAADLELDDTLMSASKTSIIARANPPLVLEAVQEKFDPQAIVSTVQPLSTMLGDGDSTASGESGQSRAYREQEERRRYEYSNFVSMMGRSGTVEAQRMMREYIRHVASMGINEHCLPDGRMITQSSSLGGKTSMNENAMFVFINTQKQKKLELLDCMNDMYARIYAVHHLLQRLANTPRGMLQPEMLKSTGVNILITGLPQDEILNQLFLTGVLKYESYVKFMSAKHNIPVEDFEKKPKLSLEDLNSIDVDDEMTGPAAKKSKKKK